ncbi:unnamed protein product [Moneuplotes crassus]|uniref:Exocyst complex component Sec10 n=2 Tax=Euplotes crassus TaxID=5936 RepID=A0AAD1YAV2_EUPCR|nr:unnamed protein product [Moneuplotes crassus]
MDIPFERSQPDPRAGQNDFIVQLEEGTFDGAKTIQQSCEFIMEEYVRRGDWEEVKGQDGQDLGAAVDYKQVHEFLDMQTSQLKEVLDKMDGEIVEHGVSQNTESFTLDIEDIEKMYNNSTKLVNHMDRNISTFLFNEKLSGGSQTVHERLKSLDTEKKNYKLTSDIVTLFQKLNTNSDQSLEIIHDLTKNNSYAKEIHILGEMSKDIVNSDFMIAKENCISMHKQFIQRLELELEDLLVGKGKSDRNKNSHSANAEAPVYNMETQKIIGVFETIGRLENAVRIYTDFFINELKIKPISPNETNEKIYKQFIETVHEDILMRLQREFSLTNGRFKEGFPHRARFSNSLLHKYLTCNYKSFILTFLETEGRSKETFCCILYTAIISFKNFKQKILLVTKQLKIGNETSIENILEEIFIPFRKMYLTKEQAVLRNNVGEKLQEKITEIQKIKMPEIILEHERNFFDKINIVGKGLGGQADKDNFFFKLAMVVHTSALMLEDDNGGTNHSLGISERVLDIPLEEDLEKTVKTIVNLYFELINNYFMELCSKITEYLDAIEQEQGMIPDKPAEEEKKLIFFKSRHSDQLVSQKASYRPPVEYFKFVFSLEKLVQVCMGKVTKILQRISSRKELIKNIEVDRESILSNMATLIKVANQEIIEKINLHCHYILSKCLRKLKSAKKADIVEVNAIARDEVKSFIQPFFKILSDQDDHTHNATRLLQSLAGNTIETLLVYYKKPDLVVSKKPQSLSVFKEDIVAYNEIFQDINSEKVAIMYEKFKRLVKE